MLAKKQPSCSLRHFTGKGGRSAMNIKHVRFYKTEEGNCPAKDFLDSLPPDAARKVNWVLSLLVDMDVAPPSYFTRLDAKADIWECRVPLGLQAYCLFCFITDDSSAVFTHGLIETDENTTNVEIMRVESYREKHIMRKGISDPPENFV